MLGIGNLAPTDESGAFQVVLTTGAGASSVSAGNGRASARRGAYEGEAALGR